MSNKLTNRVALQSAIDVLTTGTLQSDFSTAEIVDKLEKMIAQLEKKDAAPKKLTEQQKRNEIIKTAILDFLAANPENGYTVSDLIKEVPECAASSNQHISALVRALDLDQRIMKYTEKRRTYVKIAA